MPSRRMSRISNSTVHTPRDPENLKESYHQFLGIAADRAGQDVGDIRKTVRIYAMHHGLPGVSQILKHSKLYDVPPSPRDWNDVN